MKTKTAKKIAIGLFLVLLVSSFVIAQDELPQYNFGSAQGAKSLSGKPGQNIEGILYFYNVYGNRPTHIKLEIAEKPDWEISLNPSVRSVPYEVSGVVQNVEENLVVYPSEAQEKAGDFQEGKEWISSKVGYLHADYVKINIKIPENEEIGKTFNLKIKGTAFWLGQEGTIALQQEREFDYAIRTTTEYYEKPVEDKKSVISDVFSFVINPLQLEPVPAIFTGTAIILLIVFIMLLLSSRRKKKKNKNIAKQKK